MRTPTLIRVCGVVALVAALILGGSASTSQAGPLAQGGTAASTAEPTSAPTQAVTEAVTSPATQAATAAATKYPPCPGTVLTPEPTAEPTEIPTIEATSAATVEPFTPGFLGIAGETVDGCGVRITRMDKGTPAEVAGLQLGDVIVAYNGKPLPVIDSLRRLVEATEPGTKVEIVVKRGEDEVTVTATIGVRPPRTPPTATR